MICDADDTFMAQIRTRTGVVGNMFASWAGHGESTVVGQGMVYYGSGGRVTGSQVTLDPETPVEDKSIESKEKAGEFSEWGAAKPKTTRNLVLAEMYDQHADAAENSVTFRWACKMVLPWRSTIGWKPFGSGANQRPAVGRDSKIWPRPSPFWSRRRQGKRSRSPTCSAASCAISSGRSTNSLVCEIRLTDRVAKARPKKTAQESHPTGNCSIAPTSCS